MVKRAHELFDEVIVVVAGNAAKNAVFSVAERVSLVRAVVADLPGVTVDVTDGLIAQYCVDRGARVLVRGVRSGADVDQELAMSGMNRAISGVDTVFLPARPEHAHVASSLVKDVARHGGDVSAFVPPAVAVALRERFSPTE